MAVSTLVDANSGKPHFAVPDSLMSQPDPTPEVWPSERKLPEEQPYPEGLATELIISQFKSSGTVYSKRL